MERLLSVFAKAIHMMRTGTGLKPARCAFATFLISNSALLTVTEPCKLLREEKERHPDALVE
jgi:hypothetical protein